LARAIGSSPETLFADAKRFTDRYSDLMRPGPDGKVALAPALQAIAADEGLDYRELEASAPAVPTPLAAPRRAMDEQAVMSNPWRTR
jgi:hypothetical protein